MWQKHKNITKKIIKEKKNCKKKNKKKSKKKKRRKKNDKKKSASYWLLAELNPQRQSIKFENSSPESISRCFVSKIRKANSAIENTE